MNHHNIFVIYIGGVKRFGRPFAFRYLWSHVTLASRFGETMQKLIASRLPEIAALCRRHHVRRLAVFGSATRNDFDPERSDVDLRVEFGPIQIEEYADNYFDLRESLVTLFGREVDLVSAREIRNPYLREEIERTQETLYAA